MDVHDMSDAKHFRQALEWLDEDEGGYSNRSLKDDPGGETNMGITHRVYQAWRRRQKLEPKSVKYITRSEANGIYQYNYWRPLIALEDDPAVRLCVFDCGVNSGVATATRMLQKCLKVKQDAVIGAITLGALDDWSDADIIITYCKERMAYMKRLDNWEDNENGWTNRVNRVKRRCLGYSPETNDLPVKTTKAEADVYRVNDGGENDGGAKAEKPDRESPAKSRTIQGAVAAGVSGVGGIVAAVSQLDGNVQLALIGAAVVCVLGVAVVFRERLLKWSDGER